ncbi:MAG: 30S ribosomal protein S8 [Deltaproteobacteria bacterium]|jgi:small subunit ribosomal protein S8
MMTDPIADMLTRIRNAVAIERPFVDIPMSHEKEGIAQVLQREGYIWDFEIVDQQPVKILRVNLKYGPNGERIIQEIKRVSKPGCRVYKKSRELPVVLEGMGISVVSTSQGIFSNREAMAKGIGGEVLCSIY